jgi:hypothetical protein
MSYTLNSDRLIIKDYLYQNVVGLVKCKICLNVLNEPYDCQCCSNTFCFSCINSFIIKTGKCPFGVKEDEGALTKLKPSSLAIINFLSGLRFTCTYKQNGCSEDLFYNNIVNHEVSCPYIDENLSNHKSSFVSFNPKFDYTETVQEMKQVEKIDKIYEMVQYLQFSISHRNLNITPTKEANTETPRFSIGLSSSNNPNIKQYTSESIRDSYSLTQNLQNEKIISELDYLNEKISNLENTLDNHIRDQENLLKRNLEEQFTNILDKIRENTLASSTIYSSVNNSLCNSTQNIAISKTKSSNKMELKSNNSVKKIKLDCKKLGGSFINNNLQNSPKNVRPPFNTSPRIVNKNLSKLKEFNSKSKMSESFVEEKNRRKSNIDTIGEYYTEPNEILTKENLTNSDEIDKDYMEELFNKLQESIKVSSLLNEKLVDEIKTNFLEVTMDSTNVFVQKFDEFIYKLKLTPFKLNI